MKTKFAFRSAFIATRVMTGFVLCSTGLFLALAGLSKSVTGRVRHDATKQFSSVAKSLEANAQTRAKLTYRIIDAPNHTWSYDVFADSRLMIHQTSIPALPGNEGFKTKEDATKVALIVIAKIKKGEMPPTISIEEMKKLNVIK